MLLNLLFFFSLSAFLLCFSHDLRGVGEGERGGGVTVAAVHSIKWKLALNMLRAAAESKSVSLGRQWNEKGTGAGTGGNPPQGT